MAIEQINKDALPPTRWAQKVRYGDGKSTFIQVLRQPAFIVDADGCHHELKGGELYELSEEAADNTPVEQIQDLLGQNMPRFGIKTVAINSITPLIGSSITCAMLDNAADGIADRNQAWVVKALWQRRPGTCPTVLILPPAKTSARGGMKTCRTW
jgi:dephospho-CoA kinase